jgi:hypothetical protein
MTLKPRSNYDEIPDVRALVYDMTVRIIGANCQLYSCISAGNAPCDGGHGPNGRGHPASREGICHTTTRRLAALGQLEIKEYARPRKAPAKVYPTRRDERDPHYTAAGGGAVRPGANGAEVGELRDRATSEDRPQLGGPTHSGVVRGSAWGEHGPLRGPFGAVASPAGPVQRIQRRRGLKAILLYFTIGRHTAKELVAWGYP